MTQGGSNPWSRGPNTPAVRRRWQQARRRARVRSSGVQMDGGERLRRAGAHLRPFQQAAAARAAGDDGLELGSGGRSSGVLGFGVTRHGGRGRWALRDAGVTRNTRRQRAQAEELGSTELTGHGGRRLRCSWGGGYRAQSKGERGRGGVGAHSGAVEEVSELGEVLAALNRPEASSGAGGGRRRRW